MGSICDVQGIRVGHDTDVVGVTGCTVVLCEGGAVGGVDVRGGAPGTRETDLLRRESMVDRVHAVVLTGGSAFGLDAAVGVTRELAERGVGFPVGPTVVPIVPAAVLFDLLVGDRQARPDAAAGARACRSATAEPPAEGSVGAGTGATVGKIHGHDFATKGGIGSASVRTGGVTVGAIVAVNAVGNVVNPTTGQVVAGLRRVDGTGFLGMGAYHSLRWMQARGRAHPSAGANTTIGVVATDAPLDKAGVSWLARVAHDGLALAIRPAHTPYDGDTLFALSVGSPSADARARAAPDRGVLGVAAVQAVAEAVVRAARAAKGLGGIPAASELRLNRPPVPPTLGGEHPPALGGRGGDCLAPERTDDE